MKAVPAIALALVGWYLLMLPQVGTTTEVDPDAPLSKWQIWSVYDKAQECKLDLGNLQEGLAKWAKNHTPSRGHDLDFDQKLVDSQIAYSARCIATHDPRLKDK